MLDAVTMLGRRDSMERTGKIKFYYDPEGDYMQVTFQKKAGYFRETEDDRAMEKVDAEGNVLGFSVMKTSSAKRPFTSARGRSGRRKGPVRRLPELPYGLVLGPTRQGSPGS
jgi:hypothetical protein